MSTILQGVRCAAYFISDVLAKRLYFTEAMCRAVVRRPTRREVQPDGRIRHYGFDDTLGKWLRVVTLTDGDTIHNACPDRGFRS